MAANEPKIKIVYKKKRGGEAHHGGAWKVAYADFVTAMMALFIVLWILAVTTPQTKKEIAQWFRDPGMFKTTKGSMMDTQGGAPSSSLLPMMGPGAPPRPPPPAPAPTPPPDPLQATAAELRSELDRALGADPELADLKKQVMITVTDEGILIQLMDRDRDKELMFDLSSAELKPAMKKLLDRLAPSLVKMGRPLYVGGHTDARNFPDSSIHSNWDLSFSRADNARRVLEANGLSDQVRRVVAYGSSLPLVPEDPLAPHNRRLSILALRDKQH